MLDAQWLYVAAAAVLGLLIGSFLNVCIYRLPRDLSVVKPRSFCPECSTQIPWFHNVPVLSFITLKGECHACHKPIAWRYPLVEFVTAVLFGFCVYRFGVSAAALKWIVFFGVLVTLFWTDAEEHLLPDEFTVGGLVAGLIFAFFVPLHGALFDMLMHGASQSARSVVAALFAAAMFSLPLWGAAKVYERVRQPDALGLGDVKLLALLGAFLGFSMGLQALILACVSGAVYGVIYARIKRQSWRTATLPFGAFLSLAGIVVVLLNYK